MSANAAARSIATGELAEQLPASVAALDAGTIGFAHLALLAGTARADGPQLELCEAPPEAGAWAWVDTPTADSRHGSEV